MDRDTAVARIHETLGFRSDKTTEIIAKLQDVQDLFEGAPELPWFLITEVESASTVSGEERVALPVDFLREWEDDALYYFNSTATADADKWVELEKGDLSVLRKKYPGSGAPVAYSLDGDYFRIFPTPDDVYTLKQIYYKKDALLTSNIENDWLKHGARLLIGEAGMAIAAALRDAEALAEFTRQRDDGARLLLIENEARSSTARRYVMGDTD